MSFYEVQKQSQKLDEVNPEKENWNIIVRVISSWFVPDFSIQRCPFSMELVIQDKEVILRFISSITVMKKKYLYVKHIIYIHFLQGGKIHASIRRTLIYKFQNEISEGHVFGIQNFSVAPNNGIYRTTHHPYKINFQFGTKFSLLDTKLVSDMKPQYTPLCLLTTSGFDTNYLVAKLILYFFIIYFLLVLIYVY